MSLFATRLAFDADSEHELECGRWQPVPSEPRGGMWAVDLAGQHYRYRKDYGCTCRNEGPLVYRGSHVNPGEDDPRGGSLMVCAIPSFCGPRSKSRGGDDDSVLVDFLRVSMREDPATYQGGQVGDATVVLDRHHVEMLRDSLTEWLERGPDA